MRKRVEEEWEGSQKRRRRVQTENTEEEHRGHGEERGAPLNLW